MSFADTYLNRYASHKIGELPGPDPDLSLIVVVPVYNEPGLISSLKSLEAAEPPAYPWEIILVINEPEDCPGEYHLQNHQSINEIETFAASLDRPDLGIHVLTPDPFPLKKAGPGIARKIGMDEAVRRFNQIEKPGGIIVSFDADTVCSHNYLRAIAEFYDEHPNAGGCTAYFEHPLDTVSDDPIHLSAIVQYELYLRYFRMSLDWMDFPYSCISLGSAFSVRANRYVRAGGMGLQQAGEDFYFLQKCIPHGNFWELNTCRVMPSARISDRVVFGTGPFIARFIDDKEKDLIVYPFGLFRMLRPVFSWIKSLKAFPASASEFTSIICEIQEPLRSGIRAQDWEGKFSIALEESAGLDSFRKRLFREISLLQIVKLFNDLVKKDYLKRPVVEEFRKLLTEIPESVRAGSSMELLLLAREINKSRGNYRIS